MGGMLGAIEVFSRAAVQKYAKYEADCQRQAHPESSGEDGYIHSCMQQLKVHSRDDFDMLLDNYCRYGSCSNSGWSVAYHPFKNTQKWLECWHQAKASI